MPASNYTKPVAYVNKLGYLYCYRCAEKPGFTPKHELVKMYPDNSALDGDSCDRCNARFVESNNKWYPEEK